MKKIILLALISSVALFTTLETNATLLTAEFNVDNGYRAYISTSDSIQGILFGSGNDWTTTLTNTTTLAVATDYYLHVEAYDQGGIAGFLGEFTLSGTDHIFANSTLHLLTNTTAWKGNNLGWGNPYLPSLTDLGLNGVSPWGNRPNIPGTARWIWAGNANDNNTAWFSTKISSTTASIPEPATILLFGTGITGLAGMRIKREKK